MPPKVPDGAEDPPIKDEDQEEPTNTNNQDTNGDQPEDTTELNLVATASATYRLADQAMELRAATNEDDLMDDVMARGGHIDPGEVFNGIGEYFFLNLTIDPLLAAALADKMNQPNPLEQTIALEDGRLAKLNETSPERLPVVVFYPNQRYLNPPTRPRGPGTFRFLSEGPDSARELARVNLGGQNLDLGGQRFFQGNNDPSAEEVWLYRRIVRRRIEQGLEDEDADHSVDIDLVFCPEEDSTAITAPTDTPSQSEESDDLDRFDSVSGLEHNPSNPHIEGFDQTHTGTAGPARYQTRKLPEAGDLIVTVDRSRCHKDDYEPNKLKVINKKGKVKTYAHAVDWGNKVSVEKLNKWREQGLSRAEFYKKRPKVRATYTREEREWLFDTYVAPNNGERPSNATMREVTDAFNDQFPPEEDEEPRTVTGITSLYDRLRGEYATYGGQMKPRNEDSDVEIVEYD